MFKNILIAETCDGFSHAILYHIEDLEKVENEEIREIVDLCLSYSDPGGHYTYTSKDGVWQVDICKHRMYGHHSAFNEELNQVYDDSFRPFKVEHVITWVSS